MSFSASLRSSSVVSSLLTAKPIIGSSGSKAEVLMVDTMRRCRRRLSSQQQQQLRIYSSSSSSTCSRLPTVAHGCALLRTTNTATSIPPSRSGFSSNTKMMMTTTTTFNPTSTQPLPSSAAAAAATTPSSSSMKDEYGKMTSEGETYVYPGDFILENGQVLVQPQLRYMTYGDLNERRDNVLVICHALTGNASLHTWWGGLLGPHKNRAFDTSQYFVICCNILGSCYGSTGPQSIDPTTQTMYNKDFPDVSVQDTVRLQLNLLQQHLGIESVASVIGGSFGGMQAVEFAVQGGSPHADFTTSQGTPFVRSAIPIACGAKHTAWQIAISEVQRQAIYEDLMWNSDTPHLAESGLYVARQMGMISYRTPHAYQTKFGRRLQQAPSSDADSETTTTTTKPVLYGSEAEWQVKSYLQHQGHKFLDRFDAVTYVKLTEQMDSHDVGRNRGDDIAKVLSKVTIPARILGIDSDILYPLTEQQELADLLPNGELKVIHSVDGHDGFLLEQDQVAGFIQEFLQNISKDDKSKQ